MRRSMPKIMKSVPTMKRSSGSHAIASTPKTMQRTARIGLLMLMPIFLRLLSTISVISCFRSELDWAGGGYLRVRV